VKDLGELPVESAAGLMRYLIENPKNLVNDPALDEIFGGVQ
jgi:hypothetical protein